MTQTVVDDSVNGSGSTLWGTCFPEGDWDITTHGADPDAGRGMETCPVCQEPHWWEDPCGCSWADSGEPSSSAGLDLDDWDPIYGMSEWTCMDCGHWEPFNFFKGPGGNYLSTVRRIAEKHEAVCPHRRQEATYECPFCDEQLNYIHHGSDEEQVKRQALRTHFQGCARRNQPDLDFGYDDPDHEMAYWDIPDPAVVAAEDYCRQKGHLEWMDGEGW